MSEKSNPKQDTNQWMFSPLAGQTLWLISTLTLCLIAVIFLT